MCAAGSSATGRVPTSATPGASATTPVAADDSRTGARSTSHAPPENALTDPAATSSAGRVLPTPPAPVDVTSRDAANRRRTSAAHEASEGRRQTPWVSCRVGHRDPFCCGAPGQDLPPGVDWSLDSTR